MGSWPIVARPDHVDRLVDALVARPARAQMLRGPSGVGKTTVAAAAASALAAKGRTIVPVVALDELRDVPLGALSPLLGASRFAPHDDVGERLHELIALVGSHADTYLLVVDDAPLLDATSAAALYQLVRVFAVPALLTARDEHPMTGALARLLHEDLVTVSEIPGLALDETRELLLSGIERIAHSQAAAYGLLESEYPRVEVEEIYTPALYNSPELAERAVAAMRERFGAENVVETDPVMGGEDYSQYHRTEHNIPTFMFWVGGTTPGRLQSYIDDGVTPPSNHSPFFAPDDPQGTIVQAAEAMTAVALDILGTE